MLVDCMDIGVDDENVRSEEIKPWLIKPNGNNQTGGGTVEQRVYHSEWLDKLWLQMSAQEKTNSAPISIAGIYEFDINSDEQSQSEDSLSKNKMPTSFQQSFAALFFI